MSAAQMLPAVIELSVISPSNTNGSFQLRSDHSVFIGTSNNCGLSLSGSGVDEIHCYMRFEDGRLWVEDWMSKSGTLINGERIAERTEVHLGDSIQVGANQIVLQPAAPSILAAAPRLTITAAATIDDDKEDLRIRFNRFDGEQAINPSDNHDLDQPGERESIDQFVSRPEACERVDGFSSSFFDFDEDETYDQETVALLRAEVEHLQAALAQRDAGLLDELTDDQKAATAELSATEGVADPVLARMQELIEEANRSDERAAMLEELLLVAEVANAAEVEERRQLEAWVDDIEQRLAQRDTEHQAELESLQQRLAQAAQMHERLIQQLRQVTANQTTPPLDPAHFEQLQQDYQQSQQELAESKKQCAKLQQRLTQVAEEPQRAVREDRVRLAEEQKQIAKLQLELSSKLSTLATSGEPESRSHSNADQRIKALRDHLLQIHEQEQQAARTTSLAGRLKRLWQRVDG